MMKVVMLASRMADSARLVAQLDGAGWPFGGLQFFADTLENQHVGVNRHTDGQHDPRDAGQCQRAADHREHAKDQADVDDQAQCSQRYRTTRRSGS